MQTAACAARSKRTNQRVTLAVVDSSKVMPTLEATHTAGSERMPSPPGVMGVATITGISWGKAPVATLNSGAALPGIENVMNAWGCVDEVWTLSIVAAEYGGTAAVSTTRTKCDRVGGGRQFGVMHRRHGSGCATNGASIVPRYRSQRSPGTHVRTSWLIDCPSIEEGRSDRKRTRTICENDIT